MNKRNLLFELTMLSLMIVTIIFIYKISKDIRSEGYACQMNPLVYGAKKLGELNHHNLTGTAYFDDPKMPSIYFDKFNMTINFHKVDGLFLKDFQNITLYDRPIQNN